MARHASVDGRCPQSNQQCAQRRFKPRETRLRWFSRHQKLKSFTHRRTHGGIGPVRPERTLHVIGRLDGNRSACSVPTVPMLPFRYCARNRCSGPYRGQLIVAAVEGVKVGAILKA
jgi:hypothetical protein